MFELRDGMLSQNKNKEYLISVEKSIKQTQRMVDLGITSIENIEQIVGFFKIEKLYQLIFDEDPKNLEGGVNSSQ